MSFFSGSPGSYEKLSTKTSQQQKLLNQAYPGLKQAQGSGLEWLNNILSGNPEALAAYEAPYLRQFEEETVPGLAERFSALGAQRSSAFGQSLSGAAGKLQENLAAQKAQLQQGALGYLNSMMNNFQQPQFQYTYQQGQPSIFSQLAPAIGAIGGALIGGPAGAAIGGGIGQGIGGLSSGGISSGGGGQYAVSGQGMGSPFSMPYGGNQYAYSGR